MSQDERSICMCHDLNISGAERRFLRCRLPKAVPCWRVWGHCSPENIKTEFFRNRISIILSSSQPILVYHFFTTQIHPTIIYTGYQNNLYYYCHFYFRLLDLRVKHLITQHLIVQRQGQKSLPQRDFLTHQGNMLKLVSLQK